MRIFYYFQDLETNMFDWQRVHIIDELSHHGVEVVTFNPLYYYTPEEANDKALQILRKGGYDLFFTNVCYYKMLFVDTVCEIKKMGIPTLCLRCDNLIIPFNDKVLAPYFDLVWLTSFETQHLYNKWGVKSFFAPYAANPFFFNYVVSEIIRRPCFIGTPYGSRSIMINNLTENGIDVDVYYKSSPIKGKIQKESRIVSKILTQNRIEYYMSNFMFKEGRKILIGSLFNRLFGETYLSQNDCLHSFYRVAFNEMTQMYSKYTLCLSSTSTNHTDALKKPLNVINLRAFEIPMSGGIMLCRYSNELANYFEDGKEIIFYRNKEDMLDKAFYYTKKASDNEIIKIKKAARFRAENEHTWWCRFSIIFRILGLDKI